jgi:Rrf2 family protein
MNAAADPTARESRLRSLAKAVSWRCVGTLDTFVVSFVVLNVTGAAGTSAHAAQVSGGIAGVEVITKIVLSGGRSGENRGMKVSVQIDYACRVMAELARLHGSGELAQIEHLARTEAVPANFLAQILSKLRNHGLIASRRGSQGGYVLARAPEQISLYDILLAVEGECLQFSGTFDGRSGHRVKQVWNEVRKGLVEKTLSITLNQLAVKTPAEMYYI